MGIDLFNSLVRYYLSKSLPISLRNMEGGRVNSVYGEPHEQGEENKFIHGVVIFANGDTLARRLVDDRVIKDVSYPQFTLVKNNTDLECYLIGSRKHDGAFFYNGSSQSIARANWVNDEPNGTSEIASRYVDVAPRRHLLVPPDFVCDGERELDLKQFENTVGRRTGLAVVVPFVYTSDDSHVQAYQLKQSAYGSLGMGTVNQYGPEGLSRRFLLRYEPGSKGPFIDSDYGITGYVQQLKPVNGRVRVIEEQRVDPLMFVSSIDS